VGVFYDFIFVEAAEAVYDLASFHPIFFWKLFHHIILRRMKNVVSSSAMSLYAQNNSLN